MESLFLKITDKTDMLFEQNTFSTYLNPYQYLKIRRNTSLISKVDYFFFDGFLLKKIYNMIFKTKIKTLPPDMSGLLPSLFDYCSENNLLVGLIGSSESNIKNATTNIKLQFPNLNIAYYRSGFFENKDDLLKSIEIIKNKRINYLLVGMGVPKQEEFLILLKQNSFNGNGISCGGFFHQTAKRKHYYPKMMQIINLRWLYRVFDEPKLIFRYCIIYPIGILYFIFDSLKFLKKNSYRILLV